MKKYLKLMEYVLKNGERRMDRTGTGTVSLFGHHTRYDLKNNFPLITTKKIHLRSVIHELLWFLRGETNTRYLKENKVRIWDEWADDNGELGPIYGKQWRKWSSPDGDVDQIKKLIDDIRTNPTSRRLIVSAWNPADLNKMKLPPCHAFMQFYVNNGYLSCQLYQRSADIFLGVPFNIASYSLLTLMIAKVCKLKPNEFIHCIGDAHIYLNHLKQVKEQLSRKPKELPRMIIRRELNDITQYTFEDFELKSYQHHPHIKGEVSV